jgi:hypothetical protein
VGWGQRLWTKRSEESGKYIYVKGRTCTGVIGKEKET